jgi:hypothetical protein
VIGQAGLLQQSLQRRLRFNYQTGRLPSEKRRVSDVLQGVAKPVKTADHHALSPERLAIPKAIHIRTPMSVNLVAFAPSGLEIA